MLTAAIELTLESRAPGGKKKTVSNGELTAIFYRKMRAYSECPYSGTPISIAPVGRRSEWKVVTALYVSAGIRATLSALKRRRGNFKRFTGWRGLAAYFEYAQRRQAECMLGGVGNEFRISQSPGKGVSTDRRKRFMRQGNDCGPRDLWSVASTWTTFPTRPRRAPCAGAAFFGAASLAGHVMFPKCSSVRTPKYPKLRYFGVRIV